jgi:hypothetical protein
MEDNSPGGDNPYQPPVESADTFTAAAVDDTATSGKMQLSDHGCIVVQRLTRWMRIVSVCQYIATGLLVVAGIFMFVLLSKIDTGGFAGSSASKITIGMSIATILLIGLLLLMGARWLRASANQFDEGVLANEEAPLAGGFRQLRVYLILYGIYGIINLVMTILPLVWSKAATWGN